MPKRDRQLTIRSCVERFAADLTDILARAALESVRAALEPGANSLASVTTARRSKNGDRRPSVRAPLASRTTASALPESDVPISLDAYERQAILRALDENGGNAIAAGAALARAAADHPHGRARRMAERDAIYSTLEQHRLLTRTRGGQPLSRPSNRKGIS